MGLADFDGFIDALIDKERIKDTALAAGGGMLGGAIHEVAVAKIEFLRSGDGNMPLLKQLGARLGMAMIVSALIGEAQPALAGGYVGGVMGGFGVDLLEKFAPEMLTQESAAPQGTEYYPLAEQYSSKVQLQGLAATRTYTGKDIPANVGGLDRIRVSKADPYALAAMHASSY